jgi:hypothetical protein
MCGQCMILAVQCNPRGQGNRPSVALGLRLARGQGQEVTGEQHPECMMMFAPVGLEMVPWTRTNGKDEPGLAGFVV